MWPLNDAGIYSLILKYLHHILSFKIQFIGYHVSMSLILLLKLSCYAQLGSIEQLPFKISQLFCSSGKNFFPSISPVPKELLLHCFYQCPWTKQNAKQHNIYMSICHKYLHLRLHQFLHL